MLSAGRVKYKDSCRSRFLWQYSLPDWKANMVPVEETIRGFREILDGKLDDVPESYFLNAGTIDEVKAAYAG